jgi:hypothetical protein
MVQNLGQIWPESGTDRTLGHFDPIDPFDPFDPFDR